MTLPYSGLISFLFLFVIIVFVSGDLVLISPPSGDDEGGDATPTFYVSAKSRDLVVRGGDTVDLTCHTSQAWHLCSWRMPSADWCDRLSHSKYDTSCPTNSRVRFQVSK